MEDKKLLMVTDGNNNKYYDMHDNGDGTFTVHWGRVGTDGKYTTYSTSDWNKKLREKLNKGYKDITANYAISTDFVALSDPDIDRLLTHFLSISRQYVNNYTTADYLAPSAIQDAQDNINNMMQTMNIQNPDQSTLDDFNKYLMKLFMIIPRKMKRVQDNLCKSLDKRLSIINSEQSLLDNMIMLSNSKPTTANQTILDVFKFDIVKCTDAENDFIRNKLKSENFTRFKFKQAWKLTNDARDTKFNDYLSAKNLDNNDDNVKLYWHGTGQENLLSIMSNGLIIRPSNAAYTGSMFGDGIYNAPMADKAAGYTSISGSYWKGGSESVGYMFLNSVITGNTFDVNDNYARYGNVRVCDLNGTKFEQQNLDYHSVYAHAGSALRRDEVIVYNEGQVACRYLVEFTR